MLLYVSESIGGGAERAVQALENKFGFERLQTDATISTVESTHILEYATTNYTRNMVFKGNLSLKVLRKFEVRPFFIHIALDSSLRVKINEWATYENGGTTDLEKYLTISDAHLEQYPELPVVLARADIKLFIRTPEMYKFDILAKELGRLLTQACHGRDITVAFNNTTPLRPDWDSYFMKLATLAASRSNCMKRRVGCVIVRDCRVIATGYNGTPRHLKNCHSGGCPRCNSGNSAHLSSCLCLHAEENALLEAGRDRVGANAILYCDTCPCLTCSVKIVQTGIREVVYSQSYRMDEESFRILQEGGVLVRQFSFMEDPRFSVL
ncbi:LADA_0E02894g1_1 [Lachancea dasiensis]|uniref:Deoxycytidylate deaminase n=1 Tax=Lachancea dasiensis TaxID=1072105 RepID=A0A1G4JBL8_9SACH|nr:LADA_0E02894g1_1 [Lachancea dasiensis]